MKKERGYYMKKQTKKENDEERKEFYRMMSGLDKLDDSRRSRITNDEISIQQQTNLLNEDNAKHGYTKDHIDNDTMALMEIDNTQKRLDIERKAFNLEYKKATLKYEKMVRDGQ